MIKTLFHVPLTDNAGHPFPQSLWDRLDEHLLRFGGFSVVPGVRGAWRDPATGRVYNDVSNRYEVALASWADLPAWLRVVRWARMEFRQVAVYVEIAGHPEALTF